MGISDYIAFFSLMISFITLVVSIFVSRYRNQLTTKQISLSSTISVINWLEEVRPYRHILYRVRHQNKSFKDWTENELDAANKVTRQYDILGVLEELGYVDQVFVDRFWAILVYEIYEICKDWIANERSLRGSSHLWEFEQLAKRVENVKKNHPAYIQVKWPKKPRS